MQAHIFLFVNIFVYIILHIYVLCLETMIFFSGVGFYLNNISYSNNSAITVSNIGEGNNALMCLTSLSQCCRTIDTGAVFLGNWQYPNGSFVPNILQTTSLYRSRGMRAVLLHRRTNHEPSFSGIFTCTIPDSNSITKTLHIFLHIGMLPGTTFVNVFCINLRHK